MKKIAILLFSILFLVSNVFVFTNEINNEVKAEYPTRGMDDFWMDMNISLASEGTFLGEYEYDQAGKSISGAGDVNGDGYNDILIMGEGGSVNEKGIVYLILGSESGFYPSRNLSTADASFIGEKGSSIEYGPVSGGGDYNGDGYDDILICADSIWGEGFSGKIYLFFGKVSGWERNTSMSEADATFLGDGYMSFDISDAGDVNGDGYDDFLIGMSDYELNTGSAFLILGRQNGWSKNISIFDANASFIGENNGDWAGNNVEGIGDINDDGFDDIALDASGNDEGGSNSGAVYILYGKGTGWTINTPLADADIKVIGTSINWEAIYGISKAGDVNGDGISDFMIRSDPYFGSFRPGKINIFYGNRTNWKGHMSIIDANASIVGEFDGDGFGISFDGIGDINNDGYDDIIVGSPMNAEEGINAGQAYLILGRAEEWGQNVNVSSFAFASFIGERLNNYCGQNVVGVGDVNGDAMPEILISAHYNSENRRRLSGKCYLITGNRPSEPLEVYSVKLYSDLQYLQEAYSSDIGQAIYIEMIGLDSNATQIDIAAVNISFIRSTNEIRNFPLRETGENTGVYRGAYIVPFGTLYFDLINISSKKDPSKYSALIVDMPNRPSEIHSMKIFSDDQYAIETDKVDINETFYIEISGIDFDPSGANKAFVNITSDHVLRIPFIQKLKETGENTGIYRGSYQIPSGMIYFENVTVTSVRNPSVLRKLFVHTPVRIMPYNESWKAIEDYQYRSGYWNFGYNNGTWDLDSDTSWLQWDDESKELYGTPNNRHIGKWSVWLFLSDGNGNNAEHNFQLTVINTPPTILTENVLEAQEGSEYYVDYNSDDDGQGNITWSMSTYSSWLSIDEVTGELTGYPLYEDLGPHHISVSVNDGNGGIGSAIFVINVTILNRPPEILSLDITTGKEGELYYRDYDVHDPNENDLLEWFLDTNASFLTIQNDSGILTGTPGEEDVGVFFVNVTVMDQGGLFDSHEFLLTIENENDMPRWTDVPGNIEILHGNVYRFNVNATDPDLGGFLWFSIRSTPESDIEIHPDTGMIEWTASVRWFEGNDYDLDVTVEVSDGELFRVHYFTITVLPTESPTSEIIGPIENERTSSQSTMLSWSGTDPENELITYDIYMHQTEAFVIGMREEALYLEGLQSTSLNVSDLEQGKIYYWMVLPYDGCTYGSCSSGACSFRVNYRPTFRNIEDHQVPAGTDFKYKISCTDEDTEDLPNLRYSLVEAPEGMTINEETGMIRWTPDDDQVLLHSVIVQVSDGIETNTAVFEVEVTEGESSTSTLLLSILIVALVILFIGFAVFFMIRQKRKMDEEALRKGEEEREVLEKEREDEYASYEDMYGVPAPQKDEEGLTTKELKDYIHDQIEELEGSE